LSSVVVLWRFWVSGKITRERELLLKRRELRASMAISLILILLGFGVIATSSYDIALGEAANTDARELDIIVSIAGTSVFVFGGLTIFKFHYASALESESLYKDGICSLIGTILAAALFANTLIIRIKPQIWWLDPMVAMVCGFAALFIGLHSMFIAWRIKRVPVCSLSWWMMSRGDGGRNNPSFSSRGNNNNNNNNNNIIDDDDNNVEMEETTTEGLDNNNNSTKLSSEVV